MTITLSWPVIAIIIFVLVTQIWAWTRNDCRGYSSVSDRGLAVFFAVIADIIFTAIVGGIWIW